jgi:hypothetical protein
LGDDATTLSCLWRERGRVSQSLTPEKPVSDRTCIGARIGNSEPNFDISRWSTPFFTHTSSLAHSCHWFPGCEVGIMMLPIAFPQVSLFLPNLMK